MIRIGDLAKICNVSTQTLRYYDTEGILKPDIIDWSSGYRFYSVDAVEKYKKILFYKNLGFTLDEIKKIQTATDELLYDMLQQKKAILLQSIEKFDKQIKIIDEICNSKKQKSGLSELLLLPFENDSTVVGKWRLCGKLLDENELNFFEEPVDENFDRDIVFMPGGGFAWKYFWTKNMLYRISPKYNFAIPNPYKILERNGIRYMIIQFMTDECIDNGEDIMLLLYRQLDNIAYTEHQIRKNIDKTDLAFVPDESVIGNWLVCDFVPEIESFDPDLRYSCEEDFYTLHYRFLSRGICYKTLRSRAGETTEMLRYTKGFVLNDKEMTAEEYQINFIKGREFLFVQHKSGDYFYGGMTPNFYVFERNNE